MPEKELASSLGITGTTVSKYETGAMENPSYETMAKLREVFQVSSEFFYTEESPEIQYELESEYQAFRQFVCLPEPIRGVIRKLIKKEYWDHKKLTEKTALENRFSRSKLKSKGVDEEVLKSLRK